MIVYMWKKINCYSKIFLLDESVKCEWKWKATIQKHFVSYIFFLKKEASTFDKTICRRQIFHGFCYCTLGAIKRQPKSSLSVQGLSVSMCVAKHYQQHSQILHKLRKISWGSSERNFFFSKPLTCAQSM